MLIEIDDMAVECESLNQDVNLIPSTQQVVIHSPPLLGVESSPYEEREVVPLDDDPFMDTYNMSYDELQNKIVKVCQKNFSGDLQYPAFIRERVIVANTRRNLEAIATTKFTFTDVAKSNTQYMMAEKNKFAKNL